MENRFVTKYISSLAVIPANPSQSPAKDREQTILDTFGRILKESSRQLDLFGASSRMSQDILSSDTPRFIEAYEIWVTMSRQDCLQRVNVSRHLQKQSRLKMEKLLKSKGVNVAHTREKGCLSWPTIMATDAGHGHGGTWSATQFNLHNATLHRGKLPVNWPTPQTMDCLDNNREVFKRGNSIRFKSNQNIEGQAALRDAVGLLAPDSPSTNGKSQELWGTPQASDWVEGARTIPESKQTCIGRNLNRMKQKGKLNPDWVEQLMGLPVGWTDLGSWETE